MMLRRPRRAARPYRVNTSPASILITRARSVRTRPFATRRASMCARWRTPTGIESHWALLKRGYVGVYHWMSEKHLNRYVGEFEGRHNTGGATRWTRSRTSSAGWSLTRRHVHERVTRRPTRIQHPYVGDKSSPARRESSPIDGLIQQQASPTKEVRPWRSDGP